MYPKEQVFDIYNPLSKTLSRSNHFPKQNSDLTPLVTMSSKAALQDAGSMGESVNIMPDLKFVKFNADFNGWLTHLTALGKGKIWHDNRKNVFLAKPATPLPILVLKRHVFAWFQVKPPMSVTFIKRHYHCRFQSIRIPRLQLRTIDPLIAFSLCRWSTRRFGNETDNLDAELSYSAIPKVDSFIKIQTAP